MKKVGKIIVGFVVVILILVCIAAILPDSDDAEQKSNNTETSAQSTETTAVPNKEDYIFEDEYIKVSYVDCYEEQSIQGATYLALKVENKSDKSIMVSLKDASVNDSMVNTGSGVPMVVTSGKNSQQPFILFTGAAGIESANDIKTISFKILLLDDSTTETIEETKEIGITIK